MYPDHVETLEEDLKTARKFANETWNNVYSVHWSESRTFKVRLFSSTGPTHWVVVDGDAAKIGKPYPSFV